MQQCSNEEGWRVSQVAGRLDELPLRQWRCLSEASSPLLVNECDNGSQNFDRRRGSYIQLGRERPMALVMRDVLRPSVALIRWLLFEIILN